MARSYRNLAAAGLAAALLAAAGCGSSGSEESATAAGGGTQTAATTAGGGADPVAAAREELAELAPAEPQITVEKLTSPVPEGRTITYAGCPLPICVEVGRGVKEAADALGWKVRDVNQGLTPDKIASAWGDIAQQPTDGVVGVGILPNTAIAEQLAALRDADVPFVGVTSPSPVGEDMQALMAPPAQIRRDGRALADWVIADAGGEPTTALFVYDPSAPGIQGALQEFQDVVAGACPECDVQTLEISSADIGTKLPAEVVSALERAPDVRYLVFGLGDYATGVPQALAQAQLADQVKIVVRTAGPTAMADIRSGGIAAGLTSEAAESGWRAVDALARLMSGDELAEPEPVGVAHLLTRDNLPQDITAYYAVPGYREAFEQAWGR